MLFSMNELVPFFRQLNVSILCGLNSLKFILAFMPARTVYIWIINMQMAVLRDVVVEGIAVVIKKVTQVKSGSWQTQ